MSDWVWVRDDVALAVHERQLAEHGGASGVRDRGLFESAMARPRNLALYAEPDAAALAAAYAYGLARNHPFIDGNKRTAWVIARLFLVLNGANLVFDKVDAIRVMLALAAGEIGEDELAHWLRERIAA